VKNLPCNSSIQEHITNTAAATESYASTLAETAATPAMMDRGRQLLLLLPGAYASHLLLPLLLLLLLCMVLLPSAECGKQGICMAHSLSQCSNPIHLEGGVNGAHALPHAFIWEPPAACIAGHDQLCGDGGAGACWPHSLSVVQRQHTPWFPSEEVCRRQQHQQ
jgi:hypothetical protein